MEEAFSYPFMYWVGMDTTPDVDAATLAAFNDFYTNVHCNEVVASNPGFVRASRYELAEPDPRGDFGPRWLAVYEMKEEAAARTYIERDAGPPEGRPNYSTWPIDRKQTVTRWRMIWHQIVERGTAGQPPHTIFMVGMNVPAGTDEAGLEQFNDFYTGTHLPEVMEHGRYPRGTRFELYREFAHQAPGCPRFCAIYEADEEASEANRKRRADPNAQPGKRTAGPPVWEAHDTLWRLVYRRID